MVLAALCFGGGFVVGAAGVATHQLWLLYLGYGVIGGFGLGLGYLAPVANLVRWFNDRPGLATGMAIMGFGGGAMIGSPLAQSLMRHFATATSVGVAPTMVVMGVIYFAFMIFGAAIVRVPPADYRPAGTPAPAADAHGNALVAGRNVPLKTAFASPQFWLLWVALCVNTTAGISLIEGASPLIQEFFGRELGSTDAARAAAAAGFVGFISLFNMGGRFFWSTISDYIGRKATFAAFFILSIPAYLLLTHTDTNHWNSIVLFVAFVSVVLSIYGGGFSTMPAYLRDLFGTRDLNAIYGRMLTAWSVAGVAGPLLVNAPPQAAAGQRPRPDAHVRHDLRRHGRPARHRPALRPARAAGGPVQVRRRCCPLRPNKPPNRNARHARSTGLPQLDPAADAVVADLGHRRLADRRPARRLGRHADGHQLGRAVPPRRRRPGRAERNGAGPLTARPPGECWVAGAPRGLQNRCRPQGARSVRFAPSPFSTHDGHARPSTRRARVAVVVPLSARLHRTGRRTIKGEH